MKVNAQRLAEIGARAEAAFRPPWTHEIFTVECEPGDPRCPEGDPDECEGEREALRLDAPDEDPEGGQVVCDVYGLETFAGPNAAFIANARQDAWNGWTRNRGARATASVATRAKSSVTRPTAPWHAPWAGSQKSRSAPRPSAKR